MFEDEARIPAHLWIESEVRRLGALGLGVYVAARGDKMGGVVLQKISDMTGQSRLLIQQRNLDGRLGWANALGDEIILEKDADAYIARATHRDPDLWVIEIEDREMRNLMEMPSS